MRPVTQNLIDCAMLGIWPRAAAVCDFGIESQSHFEALYYPIRKGEIIAEQLDDALGDGLKITKLIRACKSNPHKNITFKTPYDDMEIE